MNSNKLQLKIRPALTEEAETVLSLWQNSARWLNSNGIYQWEPGHFNREQVIKFVKDGADIYLAEFNNEIVGTYALTWADPFIWKELDNENSGYIHRLAVNRDFKGLGIGYQLLENAEQQIRQKGKTYIRLDCMADNPRLNQYYKDYGFTFVRRYEFERKGWSANLYEKT